MSGYTHTNWENADEKGLINVKGNNAISIEISAIILMT